MSFQNSGRPARLPLIIAAVSAVCVLAMGATASAIVRPQAAPSITSSLDIAYDPCPNAGGEPAGQQHNPANLPGAACSPGGGPSFKASSDLLTAGEPPAGVGGAANFKGQVKIQVCSDATGVPQPCAGNGGISTGGAGADVLFKSGSPSFNYLQDVRCKGASIGTPQCTAAGSANTVAGPDYATNGASTALLAAYSSIRITDTNTGPPGGPYTNLGTTTNLEFDVPIACVTTPVALGGACGPAVTSANNILTPGCAVTPPCVVATGKLSNIETGQIAVKDGGDTPVDGNPFAGANSKDYARMGIFIP